MKVQAGYNAVVCDSVAPETVLDGILELLLPSGNGEGGRGFLTFVGTDAVTYRVIRDLGTGDAQLQTLDPQRRQMVTVADNASKVAEALRPHLAATNRALLADIFTLTASHLPTSETSRPANPAARERLSAIEAKIAGQARTKRLETELDAMTHRKLELDDALRGRSVSHDRVKRAEAALAPFAQLQVLPEDFLQLYETAKQREAHRDADLMRWHHERAEHERLMRASATTPVLRDWRVIVGILAGAASVGAGFWLGGPLRLIAFLDIPAFGLATFALWQNLSHRETLAVAKKRLAASDRRREQIESRDADLIARANELAAMVGMSTLEEVRETMGALQAARAEVNEAKREVATAEADPELSRLREERDALETQIRTFEAELSALALSGSDVGVLKAEAQSLRRLLGVRAERDDELGRIFRVATQIFGGDATQTAILLTQRGSQFITHLSSKKITRVEVDIDGSVAVAQTTGVIMASELPPPAQALVLLAVKGALLTALPPAKRMPMIVGPLDLGEGGDDLLRRYLTVIAQAGLQIVQLVDDPVRAYGVPNVTTLAVSV